MPGGDARSELHLHCISGRILHAQHSRRVHGAAVCSGTKALRGAPARPCSSGHRTDEKPTSILRHRVSLSRTVGDGLPALDSPFTCSHGKTRSLSLRANCKLQVLVTVQCYTNGHPHSQTCFSCIWCSVNRLCLSNETLCPIMPPSDANPRNKSPRQPAAPEGLHDRSLLRLGPPTCSSSLDPTITIGRRCSMYDELAPAPSIPAWEFSMQD